METFPIVKRKDEAAHGEYYTKRAVLKIYHAMPRSTDAGQWMLVGCAAPRAWPTKLFFLFVAVMSVACLLQGIPSFGSAVYPNAVQGLPNSRQTRLCPGRFGVSRRQTRPDARGDVHAILRGRDRQ